MHLSDRLFRRLVASSSGASERELAAHVLLLLGCCLMAFGFVFSWLVEARPEILAGYLVVGFIEGAALLLVRAGQQKRGLLFFAVFYQVALFSIMAFHGGVKAPVMNGLPPLVLFMGLTWSGRAAIWTALSAAVGTLGLAWAEQRGLLPAASPVPPLRAWAVTTGALVFTACMLALSLRVVREARQREAESRARREELEAHLARSRRLEAVGRLAAGVAHDFNNLLTVVFGEASLLERHHEDREALHDAASRILSVAERASSLTRQLLTFGRRQVVEPEELDTTRVVAEFGRLLRTYVGPSIRLEQELGDGLPRVRADRTELEQIVLNLVTNARDAMPAGGTLTLRIGEASAPVLARCPPALAAHRCVCLSVSDTGHGMDSATLEKLFEPFFTTKHSGRGTGLGLATVHGIVSRLGGHVLVDSVVGVGSRFSVVLPTLEPAAAPASLT